MNILVTGAAGFIGSNLCRQLLDSGHQVTGYDNLSTGKPHFLENLRQHPCFIFLHADLSDADRIAEACRGVDCVIHLAANADVKDGIHNRSVDIQQNIICTANVLEACVKHNVKKVLFSSTGSVYGEATQFPTPEHAEFPIQTSLYATSKLAAEGLVTTYAEYFKLRYTIFRFVSILGPHYTHGHVIDFVQRLSENPKELHVLGNGLQKKSYLHVEDCVRGVMLGLEHPGTDNQIFNLGHQEWITVRESIGFITERLGISPALYYEDKKNGWPGDNPLILLDAAKIKALGWTPRFSIRDAVIDTVDYLTSHPEMLKKCA
jgi:UDP-glucose 4-epimerase